MVHILSRGTSGDSFLLHKELPSGMLLVDVLLRSNIFPLQHLVQRRGAILDALFRIFEGFNFGPHHLIMVVLLHFEEKVHKKSYSEQTLFHCCFRGCSAIYWSIWAILVSPTLSVATIVEDISLSTNGHNWRVIQHLK